MTTQKKKQRKKKPRYFYLNGELHKVFRINRPEDLVHAWSYPQGRRVAYVWSATQKTMQRAFSITTVSSIIGRHPRVIKKYISEGVIPKIQKTYTLDERRALGKYFFSEDDIRTLYEYLITVNHGRPRNDGALVQYPLPSKAELEAMIRQDVVLYVKDKTGEFSPVWKQPDW